jgi:UDP-N-acetylglucosamine--N-acetylmuramyl-(pentapeptide) pyrophosphoryl-undecaprenol N-acetylglucosamine transferase
MRAVITGGGSGGHLYPGIAIAEELTGRIACQVLFIGTRRGLESRIVPEKGICFHTVWISGLHRKRIIKNLLFPIKMVVSFIQAVKIVHSFHPHVVIGTGGYVSWPVLTAAIVMHKTTVIQEQNRVPGLVTKILAPWVDSIHVSFAESKHFFKTPAKVHYSGNPTRKDLERISKKEGYSYFDLRPDKQTLFVFGGSQGSLTINQAVLKLVEDTSFNREVQVLWAVGPRWFESMKEAMDTQRNRIRIFPFIINIGLAYRISDLVICRAGATTIAEITCLGLPTIFIPLATAAGGHQEENARLLWETGAAEMVLENQLNTDRFSQTVVSLLMDASKRKTMSQNAKKFANPNAAKNIVDDILKKVVIHNKREVSSSTTIY